MVALAGTEDLEVSQWQDSSAVFFVISTMPRNIEIKAYVKDLANVKKIAAELSGDKSGGKLLVQRDTFFNVSQGRLKLRILQDDPEAKLIYYNRNDQGGPKLSDYHITLVKNYDDLEKTLTLALGKKGEVGGRNSHAVK